jgi:hypothetical protein
MRERSSWAQLTGTSINPEIALEGDEENLRIEAPALDGLELEDGLGGLAGEGLEAALGVGEGQAHDEAGDGVEAAAEELAIERLANGSGGLSQASGSRWRCRRLAAMAAKRRSASSMGAERSASVNSTTFASRPAACRSARCSLCRGCRDSQCSRISGAVWAKARTTSAVESVEPSLTTRTSAFQPRVANAAHHRGFSAVRTRALSL